MISSKLSEKASKAKSAQFRVIPRFACFSCGSQKHKCTAVQFWEAAGLQSRPAQSTQNHWPVCRQERPQSQISTSAAWTSEVTSHSCSSVLELDILVTDVTVKPGEDDQRERRLQRFHHKHTIKDKEPIVFFSLSFSWTKCRVLQPCWKVRTHIDDVHRAFLSQVSGWTNSWKRLKTLFT